MIDFKYLTTVMHEFHVFGKNKENKEISLLKTLLKRKQRKDTSPNFKFYLKKGSRLTS
jgi:hypothetical protein